jgi:hypothetical protein
MPAKTHAKYIVDARGKRTAIVLPMSEFDAIMRELEDLRDAQYVDESESTSKGFVGLDELRASLSKKAS